MTFKRLFLVLLASTLCVLPFRNSFCWHRTNPSVFVDRQLVSSSGDSGNSGNSGNGTKLENIVFGIGAGSQTWEHRKKYVRLWWRPNQMRGQVSLDRPVREMHDKSLPPLEVADDRELSSAFEVRDQQMKDHIRMSRLPSHLFRLKFPEVHWFVLSDDDTFFVVDNLVSVLSKYDHREIYYIGSFSESHYQVVSGFSSNMAFGGAGIALSYGLVEVLERMQDDCIRRNYHVWGVDGKLQACMAELGVPLTLEKGFHQMDIRGDATGFLASHPTTPLVSLHHLDAIEPIFPEMDRVQALDHLSLAIRADPSPVLQQSFCYNKVHNWTLKVAWGYVVQVRNGLVAPRDLDFPSRTFVEWFGCAAAPCFSFRTTDQVNDPCLRSVPFFMHNVNKDGVDSTYLRRTDTNSRCEDPDPLSLLQTIRVTKRRSYYRAARRQCCNILYPDMQDSHELEIRDC